MTVFQIAKIDFLFSRGGVAKLHFGAFGGLGPQAGAAVCGHAGPVQHGDKIRASAFEGESVSVRDLLATCYCATT